MLDESKVVAQLADAQWPDGSWGRLHTQDYRVQTKVPTTEFGVERALALGLDPASPVLDRAAKYLAKVLSGAHICRDRPERNDRWHVGVELFSAATLATISPFHPAVDMVWALWAEIVELTFQAGEYDPEAEVRAHRDLTGASVANSYLVLCNLYTLALLGARAEVLPPSLERILLDWLWNKADGITYLGVRPSSIPDGAGPGPLERWFRTHEILALFPSWNQKATETIRWLMLKRNAAGIWDLGRRASFTSFFPLGENWRSRASRQNDWSTRVLLLLSMVEADG
jgi:hypothetical protein